MTEALTSSVIVATRPTLDNFVIKVSLLYLTVCRSISLSINSVVGKAGMRPGRHCAGAAIGGAKTWNYEI